MRNLVLADGPKPRALVRGGFTLLEMILALTIGLVLMISLYSVISMQVDHAQKGRQILQEATLARSILTRMTGDILNNLQPVNPLYIPNAPGSSTTPATTPPATTPPATTTPNTTPATGTSGSTSASSSSTDTSSAINFNNGVYGTNNVLILSVSKVPRELNLTGVLGAVASTDPTQQATVCDLRRISYWLVPNGGLAKQELMQATSNDLTTIPPDVPNPDSYIFAPEVKDITFQYFDGVNWQDTWDGTTLGGVTGDIPIGPPSAIAITITFNRPGSDQVDAPKSDLSDDSLPKYKHVVAIPTGNNFPQTANSN